VQASTAAVEPPELTVNSRRRRSLLAAGPGASEAEATAAKTFCRRGIANDLSCKVPDYRKYRHLHWHARAHIGWADASVKENNAWNKRYYLTTASGT